MNYEIYPSLNERVYKEVLSNGLTVAVVPRPGFARKLAYFVTDFGSIHREFTFEGRPYAVPAGIAHFLEHKMFDMPDGRDISAELAELGHRCCIGHGFMCMARCIAIHPLQQTITTTQENLTDLPTPSAVTP